MHVHWHISIYGMEVNSEKSKLMVNKCTEVDYGTITMNIEELETVEKFKYPGLTMTMEKATKKSRQE